MEPLVYKGISQAQIENMIVLIGSSGGTVQNQGNGIYLISGHGVKSTARYTDGTLTVQINSKPFYITVSAIENGLDHALGEVHQS